MKKCWQIPLITGQKAAKMWWCRRSLVKAASTKSKACCREEPFLSLLCTDPGVNINHAPFPFEGGFWHVRHGNHLLPGSNPHDGPIVTLCRTLQPQAGECSPGQSPLHTCRETLAYIMTHSSGCVHVHRRLLLPQGTEIPPASWWTLGSNLQLLHPQLQPGWPAA